MGSYSRDHRIKQLLKEIVMNRRHYHTCVFFYVTHINQLNLILENYLVIFFYSKFQKKEILDIMDYLVVYLIIFTHQ